MALSGGMLVAALVDAAMQGLPPGANWRCMVGAPVLPALLLSRESLEHCEGLEGGGGGGSCCLV